jgi:hypothetical protein
LDLEDDQVDTYYSIWVDGASLAAQDIFSFDKDNDIYTVAAVSNAHAGDYSIKVKTADPHNSIV